MARPPKDGLDYFPHDVDMSNDEKIKALEALHGLEGYAVYNKLLERIYRAGGKLKLNTPESQKIMARMIGIEPVENSVDKLLMIISSTINLGLFKSLSWNRSKTLTSNGITKRAQVVINKRNKMKNAYEKKVSDAETHPETRQSKVKESKEKKIKAETPLGKTATEIEFEIKKFKQAGMAIELIKNYYLSQKIPEALIDEALGKKF